MTFGRPDAPRRRQLLSAKRFPAGWTVGYGSTYTTGENEVIGVLAVGHADGYLHLPGGEVLATLERGYAIATDARDGRIIRNAGQLAVGDRLEIDGAGDPLLLVMGLGEQLTTWPDELGALRHAVRLCDV